MVKKASGRIISMNTGRNSLCRPDGGKKSKSVSNNCCCRAALISSQRIVKKKKSKIRLKRRGLEQG